MDWDHQDQLFLALEKHHEAVLTVHFSSPLAAALRTDLSALQSCLAQEARTLPKGESSIEHT
jgi:hypothetical protein